MDSDNEDFDSSDSEEEDEMEKWKREANRQKLPLPKLDMIRRPPLPLILFKGSGVRSELFKTITGITLPTIVNNLSPTISEGDLLQDIAYTGQLIKYFVARGNKESAVRQPKAYLRLMPIEESENGCISDHLVYKGLHFDGSEIDGDDPTAALTAALAAGNTTRVINDSEKTNTNISSMEQEHGPNLEFDSKFESGNLFKAVRVLGRDKLIVSSRVMDTLQVFSLSSYFLNLLILSLMYINTQSYASLL